MLSLRLPAEAENRLAALAKALGCTKTHLARVLILEHLAQHDGGAHHHAKEAEDLFKRLELDGLLAQCDETADSPEEDRQWLDCAPVGKELL